MVWNFKAGILGLGFWGWNCGAGFSGLGFWDEDLGAGIGGWNSWSEILGLEFSAGILGLEFETGIWRLEFWGQEFWGWDSGSVLCRCLGIPPPKKSQSFPSPGPPALFDPDPFPPG